jgi:hypothetical protein
MRMPRKTTMAKPTNVRYQTLSKALAIIDPEGVLQPGTCQHNRVTERILAWMEEMAPEDVLRRSMDARLRFKLSGHTWQ